MVQTEYKQIKYKQIKYKQIKYKQIKYKQIGQVSKSQDCTYMFVLMLFGCLYYNVFIIMGIPYW